MKHQTQNCIEVLTAYKSNFDILLWQELLKLMFINNSFKGYVWKMENAYLVTLIICASLKELLDQSSFFAS